MQTFFKIAMNSSFALILALSSCKTKEDDGPAIAVTPGSLILNADANDLIEFTINAVAGDNELKKVQITQKPEGGITSTLKDTTLFGSTAEFFYVYTVPVGAPRILLTFTVIDATGKSLSTLRARSRR